MEGSVFIPKEVYDPQREKAPIAKQYIRSHDDSAGRNKEEEDVVNQIEHLFEAEVWVWKYLSIRLPPTAFADEKASEDLRSRYVLETNFDELDEVARDESGKQKYLTKEQRHELWATGTFSVQSNKFPEQKHVWLITPLLIAGVENIRNSWYKGLAYTVNQFTIQTPARLLNTGENSFSIIGGVRYGFRAFRDIFNLLIGVPSTYPKYAEYEVEEKTQSALKTLLFKELQEDPAVPELYRSKADPSLVFHMSPWIHFNKTAKKLDIAFSRVNNSWSVERRALGKSLYDKYVADLSVIENETEAARNERLKAVKVRVADELVEMNTEQLLHAIHRDFKDKDEAETIVQHLLAVRAIFAVTAQADTEVQDKIARYREKLVKDYPIRSRIRSWLEKNVNKELDRLNAEYKWTVHERALKIFDEKGWKQQAFFLRFFLHKMRDQKFKEVVDKELKKLTLPVYTFTWHRHIWRPKNWIITRDPRTQYYSANKWEVTETNTKQWLWVWRNYYKRITTWWSNSLLLLVYSLLNSPFGLKALFYNKPFFPLKVLDSLTGEIKPDTHYKVLTFTERIRAIWLSVRKSRAQFESEPDTGFLGKTFVRQLNRLWNYVFKGMFGTTIWTVIQPTVTLLNVVASLVGIVTSVAWVPTVVTLVQLFRFVFYEPYFNRQPLFPLVGLLLKIVFGGAARSVLAIIAGLVAHPVAGVAITTGYSIKALARYMYDFVVYGLIIKPRARIPMQNRSFVARRIQGPGLSSGYFMQISPEDALLGLTVTLERMELDYFESSLTEIINEPTTNLNNIVYRVFGVFNLQLSGSTLQQRVYDNANRLRETLTNMLSTRRSKLPSISTEVIRLTKDDLAAAINTAEPVVTDYIKTRIFPFLKTDSAIQGFWNSYDVAPNDYYEMTKKLLQQTFGSSILQPLEDQDKNFVIQVKKMNLSGFVGMIKHADVKDHLENFSLKYEAYRDDEITSATPYLYSSYFSSFSPLSPQDHISPLHKSMKALRDWTNKDEDYNKYIRPIN
eukprot:TRINITY_DN1208_c0_g1_i1.p1 TRINITY_DN1208_c0_g1~~TRINITY_DN1208_c0_g1_i1.p1  ORF type:complete len:1015 (+),score=345.47 TRINITY_DN1208_c0_g1_i1:47-3091(+)